MSALAGTNQGVTQALNRELVLKTLQHEGICTRVELSRQSGLKQGTITNIIADFVSWGLVEETGALVGMKGRRSIGIRLSDGPFRVIGLRITRKFFRIGVFALNGNVIGGEMRHEYADTNPRLVLAHACELINELIASQPETKFLALGVAVPGPYLSDIDEVAMINSFPGWRNVPVGSEIRKHLSIPVIVDHDANSGALAEWALGSIQLQHDSILYLSVGPGVGAGVLQHGSIYRGARGVAGEIGHTSIAFDGPRCECGGRGCLTLYASTLALTTRVAAALGLDARDEEPMTMGEVVKLLDEGDEIATKQFDKAMQYLGVGVVNAVYAYDPSLIIVGDEMAQAGQRVIDALHRRLAKLTVARIRDGIEIRLSGLSDESAFLGAGVLATHHVFANLELVEASPREPFANAV